MIYEWDETKRRANIAKHGYDLARGDLVFEDTCRGEAVRFISLRPASRKERRIYHGENR